MKRAKKGVKQGNVTMTRAGHSFARGITGQDGLHVEVTRDLNPECPGSTMGRTKGIVFLAAGEARAKVLR